MKDFDFPTAKKIHEINEAEDKMALEIIKELGLKDKQRIDEDELYTVLKATSPEELEDKMGTLLNSRYITRVYFVNLEADK